MADLFIRLAGNYKCYKSNNSENKKDIYSRKRFYQSDKLGTN